MSSYRTLLLALLVPMQLTAGREVATRQAIVADSARSVIRVNQLGYLTAAHKVAVICSLEPAVFRTFTVVDDRGRRVFGPAPARAGGAFGPCAATHRLDFSALRREGRYRLVAGDVTSPPVRVAHTVYNGAADTLLVYMRQQRSGFNPFFRDSVHTKDGIIVDHPTRSGEFISVSGGWADAADYLQYVTTSANATYVMLMAYRDHPRAFGDHVGRDGLPGVNGIPDVLDEARHGLEWLSAMFPSDSEMFNQLADDRDHAFWDLPTTDSSDYGWGRGGPRPVYPCTGRPQGLLQYRNRSTGLASTAGKYASAFALGSILFRERDAAFAEMLRRKAIAAYALGKRYPGVCQTAPAGAPYFYEEDNWADDMELAAAQLYALTGERAYLRDAVTYARREPVTPWMGADTARHYQWYPWHNNGHYETWRRGGAREKREMVAFYHRGLAAVARRAENGFRVGIPFIWCSNNLMASFATQAYLYRRMSGDARYQQYEAAALDWLFGANPWGVSMVIGLPKSGTYPRDPHSVIAKELKVELTGGLVDGPVYRSIFQNLKWVRLTEPDEYAAFNTGFIVYHDDIGDYSTNEPIMDGTANLIYLLAALSTRASEAQADAQAPRPPLPYAAMAARIVAALRPARGERVILRVDPAAMPELEAPLRQAFERAGAATETMDYGAVPGFEDRLARADIYVWLPTAPTTVPSTEQRAALARWLDSGKGRQVHFHWAGGTIRTDGSLGEHSAFYDSLYVAALDIDYAALDRLMDATIAKLRSGEVRVTTPGGTDLRFTLGDRPVNKQNGDASKARMASAKVRIDREIELPAGAIRVAPLERTVHGTLVVPVLHVGDAEIRNIRLELVEGRVTRASAATNEALLRDTVLAAEPLNHFRELALGFNPKLALPRGQRWLPYYGYGAGVVRLSLGDNTELGGAVKGEGGAVQWFFFPDATVAVGGEVIVRGGRLAMAP